MALRDITPSVFDFPIHNIQDALYVPLIRAALPSIYMGDSLADIPEIRDVYKRVTIFGRYTILQIPGVAVRKTDKEDFILRLKSLNDDMNSSCLFSSVVARRSYINNKFSNVQYYELVDGTGSLYVPAVTKTTNNQLQAMFKDNDSIVSSMVRLIYTNSNFLGKNQLVISTIFGGSSDNPKSKEHVPLLERLLNTGFA